MESVGWSLRNIATWTTAAMSAEGGRTFNRQCFGNHQTVLRKTNLFRQKINEVSTQSLFSAFTTGFILVSTWCMMLPSFTSAQDIGFPYGTTNTRELEMQTYPEDTAAAAVFLQEFGNAYIDNNNDHNLIFEYHARIKILKQSAIDISNYEIVLARTNVRAEVLQSVRATSFSLEKGAIVEAKLDQKNVFTVKHEKYDLKKFAIPNVKVGSVIEIQYVTVSPMLYHFRTWNFQGAYPKISSEYHATIPGNYVYNITLKGYQKLAKKESTLINECFGLGPGKADCFRYKWAMNNVPAFVEEEYMTAPSNFISSINFELAEVRQFNGRVDKITSSWKEVELVLKKDVQFGVQLKRGGDVLDEDVKARLSEITDHLERAKIIYKYIRDTYTWNGYYSKYSEDGIKKAFEKKAANIGDINLSLIAALRYAKIPADPVILSTRDNGLPGSLFPVLTDFNYVIARVPIGDSVFYLDASDDFYPFGMLPQRCFNGKARWLGTKKSSWVDLTPLQKGARKCLINLSLHGSGAINGYVETVYSGYEAVRMRKRFYSAQNDKEYSDGVKREFPGLEIKNIQLAGLEEIDAPLIQTFEIETAADENAAGYFLFNPYVMRQWKQNPFKADARFFPVDFATPIEHSTTVRLHYPADRFDVENVPLKQAVHLPDSAGKFVLHSQESGKEIVLQHEFCINKTVFLTTEYQQLKELFNRMLAIQNADLLIRRKR